MRCETNHCMSLSRMNLVGYMLNLTDIHVALYGAQNVRIVDCKIVSIFQSLYKGKCVDVRVHCRTSDISRGRGAAKFL